MNRYTFVSFSSDFLNAVVSEGAALQNPFVINYHYPLVCRMMSYKKCLARGERDKQTDRQTERQTERERERERERESLWIQLSLTPTDTITLVSYSSCGRMSSLASRLNGYMYSYGTSLNVALFSLMANH